MSKKPRLTKKDKVLPPEYQEVLALHEIKLQEEITVDTLRKLVYLYTLGMEYYNIKQKPQLQKFYNDKLIELLTRQEVAIFLDKNPIDFNNNANLSLFPEPPPNKRRQIRGSLNPSQTTLTNLNPIPLKQKQNSPPNFNKEEILKKVKDKIRSVDVKMSKINEIVTQEIVGQISQFEENKRKRKVRSKRKESISSSKSNSEEEPKEEELPQLDKETIEHLSQITSMEIPNSNINANTNPVPQEKKEIERKKSDVIARRRRVSIGRNAMLKEIEKFVENNMKEMYRALDELKESFETEIKEAEENGFPEISESLKEDMEAELENLKDQYEEQRRVETEKIRAKFQMKGNFCRV